MERKNVVSWGMLLLGYGLCSFLLLEAVVEGRLMNDEGNINMDHEINQMKGVKAGYKTLSGGYDRGSGADFGYGSGGGPAGGYGRGGGLGYGAGGGGGGFGQGGGYGNGIGQGGGFGFGGGGGFGGGNGYGSGGAGGGGYGHYMAPDALSASEHRS